MMIFKFFLTYRASTFKVSGFSNRDQKMEQAVVVSRIIKPNVGPIPICPDLKEIPIIDKAHSFSHRKRSLLKSKIIEIPKKIFVGLANKSNTVKNEQSLSRQYLNWVFYYNYQQTVSELQTQSTIASPLEECTDQGCEEPPVNLKTSEQKNEKISPDILPAKIIDSMNFRYIVHANSMPEQPEEKMNFNVRKILSVPNVNGTTKLIKP
ncbi:hypothetical protein HZS_2830, partial [Henneguya salminicola]